MLEALVLAGGSSTRMGSPKALLAAPGGQPFLVRIVRTLLAVGFDHVTVVTGVHHEGIAAACALDPVTKPATRFVRNLDPDRGQLSSLQAGLEAVVRSTTAGVLVALVDVPMVAPETIGLIIDAWRTRGAPIARPVHRGRNGHPVLFDREVFDQLRTAPMELGAKAVINLHATRIVNVPVEDSGCLVDVDTPADYEGLMRES